MALPPDMSGYQVNDPAMPAPLALGRKISRKAVGPPTAPVSANSPGGVYEMSATSFGPVSSFMPMDQVTEPAPAAAPPPPSGPPPGWAAPQQAYTAVSPAGVGTGQPPQHHQSVSHDQGPGLPSLTNSMAAASISDGNHQTGGTAYQAFNPTTSAPPPPAGPPPTGLGISQSSSATPDQVQQQQPHRQSVSYQAFNPNSTAPPPPPGPPPPGASGPGSLPSQQTQPRQDSVSYQAFVPASMAPAPPAGPPPGVADSTQNPHRQSVSYQPFNPAATSAERTASPVPTSTSNGIPHRQSVSYQAYSPVTGQPSDTIAPASQNSASSPYQAYSAVSTPAQTPQSTFAAPHNPFQATVEDAPPTPASTTATPHYTPTPPPTQRFPPPAASARKPAPPPGPPPPPSGPPPVEIGTSEGPMQPGLIPVDQHSEPAQTKASTQPTPPANVTPDPRFSAYYAQPNQPTPSSPTPSVSSQHTVKSVHTPDPRFAAYYAPAATSHSPSLASTPVSPHQTASFPNAAPPPPAGPPPPSATPTSQTASPDPRFAAYYANPYPVHQTATPPPQMSASFASATPPPTTIPTPPAAHPSQVPQSPQIPQSPMTGPPRQAATSAPPAAATANQNQGIPPPAAGYYAPVHPGIQHAASYQQPQSQHVADPHRAASYSGPASSAVAPHAHVHSSLPQTPSVPCPVMCNNCRSGIPYEVPYSECSFCHVYLCNNCVSAHPPAHQHTMLRFVSRLTMPASFRDPRSCGQCRKSIHSRFECRQCPYSVCQDCFTSAEGPRHVHTDYLSINPPGAAVMSYSTSECRDCIFRPTIGHCDRCLMAIGANDAMLECGTCEMTFDRSIALCRKCHYESAQFHDQSHKWVTLNAQLCTDAAQTPGLFGCPQCTWRSNDFKQTLAQHQHTTLMLFMGPSTLDRVLPIVHRTCQRKPIRVDNPPPPGSPIAWACDWCSQRMPAPVHHRCKQCPDFTLCNNCYPTASHLHKHGQMAFALASDPTFMANRGQPQQTQGVGRGIPMQGQPIQQGQRAPGQPLQQGQQFQQGQRAPGQPAQQFQGQPMQPGQQFQQTPPIQQTPPPQYAQVQQPGQQPGQRVPGQPISRPQSVIQPATKPLTQAPPARPTSVLGSATGLFNKFTAPKGRGAGGSGAGAAGGLAALGGGAALLAGGLKLAKMGKHHGHHGGGGGAAAQDPSQYQDTSSYGSDGSGGIDTSQIGGDPTGGVDTSGVDFTQVDVTTVDVGGIDVTQVDVTQIDVSDAASGFDATSVFSFFSD